MSEEVRMEQIWERYRSAETLPRTSWKTSYENRYREDVGYLLKRAEGLTTENKRLRELIEKQDAKVAEIRSGGQW